MSKYYEPIWLAEIIFCKKIKNHFADKKNALIFATA